jgi:G:T-mismatch repair DNA endonuclease (very short patch repair protein)
MLSLIHNEMVTASSVHGCFNSHHEAYAVIKEEFDEYWAEVMVNPNKKNGVRIADPGARELSHIEHRSRLRDELVQTGAMVLRALYDLC